MAKTYIGIDVDQSRLHVVCLEQGADGLFVRAIANREIDGVDQAAEAVSESIQAWGVATPRMAAALPSDRLLSRTVNFPFSDSRKIAAAVPLELAAQLPIDIETYFTTAIPVGRDGDVFRSFALAVPDAEIEEFLTPFDRLQLPLRVLEVAPFSELYLLPQEMPDAILVTIRETGYTVSRTEAGALQSYRHSSFAAEVADDDLADILLREVRTLATQTPEENLPIFLAGSGATVERQRALIIRLPGITVPEVAFESGRLQAEYLPALALARRAALSERKGGCNLRQGRHVYRGSLAPFRKSLIAIAVLLTLTVLAIGSGFWFDYASKAGELKRLDQTLETIYRQSFPRSPVPADVPLYLASNLAGLHEESRLLGTARTGPLYALEALTAGVGAETGIDVQEFNFDVESVTFLGHAASFDAVDQLAARLRQQAVFEQVQIGDAKMNIDGSRVDFRVDIDLGSVGGQP